MPLSLSLRLEKQAKGLLKVRHLAGFDSVECDGVADCHVAWAFGKLAGENWERQKGAYPSSMARWTSSRSPGEYL
jgi:hypothetical protein